MLGVRKVSENEAHVGYVYVDAAYQGLRLSSILRGAMIKQVKQWYGDRSGVELTLDATEEGYGVYERWGFKTWVDPGHTYYNGAMKYPDHGTTSNPEGAIGWGKGFTEPGFNPLRSPSWMQTWSCFQSMKAPLDEAVALWEQSMTRYKQESRQESRGAVRSDSAPGSTAVRSTAQSAQLQTSQQQSSLASLLALLGQFF